MKDSQDQKNRTPRYDFIKVSISLPFALLNSFDEESARLGYTRSEAVRMAMRRLLETWTARRF